MRNEFVTAISSNQSRFGIKLSDGSIARLADYFDLLQVHNPLLHLVGPSTPKEFAIRHILESLTLLEHLPKNTKFADVGTGGGLPSIPCLVVRDDLKALLIESKEKKTNFLNHVVDSLSLSKQVRVVSRQFQEVDPADCTVVTCRALDKFTQKIPAILRWSKGKRKLFFGGPNLREALVKQGCKVSENLMPMSEQRYLFRINAKSI